MRETATMDAWLKRRMDSNPEGHNQYTGGGYAKAASGEANRASIEALRHGAGAAHEQAARVHSFAAERHREAAAEALASGDKVASDLHEAKAAEHAATSKVHTGKAVAARALEASQNARRNALNR